MIMIKIWIKIWREAEQGDHDPQKKKKKQFEKTILMIKKSKIYTLNYIPK